MINDGRDGSKTQNVKDRVSDICESGFQHDKIREFGRFRP